MYSKLFESILDSSVWLEAHTTRIVWFTFMAAMDEMGFAKFSAIGNLANRARVTEEEAMEAVKRLEAPDPHSASEEHDGKRIERVPGGWMVLNAQKYRQMASREDQRNQTRLRVQAFRDKVTVRNGVKQNVTAPYASASEGISRKGEDGGGRIPPAIDDVVALAITLEMTKEDAEAFFDWYSSNGWKVGKAKASMRNWHGALRNWKRGRPANEVNKSEGSTFWKATKEMEMVTKEMDGIRSRSGKDQFGYLLLTSDDKTTWARLKGRRDELKKELGLS